MWKQSGQQARKGMVVTGGWDNRRDCDLSRPRKEADREEGEGVRWVMGWDGDGDGRVGDGGSRWTRQGGRGCASVEGSRLFDLKL